MFKFNSKFEAVVSSDKTGMIEYWTGPKFDYKFPRNVSYESKMDTDLYEIVKVNDYSKQYTMGIRRS